MSFECTRCNIPARVKLVDGDYEDEEATEEYECTGCGARATFYLDRNGSDEMIGPISVSYGDY